MTVAREATTLVKKVLTLSKTLGLLTIVSLSNFSEIIDLY